MRVSSLSDDRIIKLVTSHFIPTWLSRDRYQMDKPDRDEVAFVRKLDTDRLKKKFVGGAVCVYLVTADGSVLAALPVQKASKPGELAPFLEKVIADEKLTKRDAERAKATAAPPPPEATPKNKDGKLFVVRTRFDGTGPNRGTARDVIELSKDEWAGWQPPEKAKVDDTWTPPAKAVEKLLRMTYPPLPHWNASNGKLDEAKVEGKVVAVTDSEVRFQVTGTLVLLYPNQGRPTDGKVTAKLVGVGRVDVETKALTSLDIVSDEAKYKQAWQGKERTSPMSFAIELQR